MGAINVEGLPKPVQIQGDTPTKEEATVILRAVEAQGGLPADRDPNILDIGVEPRTLEELTGGIASRGAFTMAGGMAGAAIGGTAGAAAGGIGALPGALVGGGLGTAAGEFAFDTAEQAVRFLGMIEGELEPLETRVMRAGKSAITDVGFAAGFLGAGQAIRAGKAVLGKGLGVTTEAARRVAKEAQELGIGVGAVDVVQGVRGRILRGTANVVGMFPFIGTPFRKEALSKAEAIIRRVDDTLNAFAPSVTMNDDLGVNMVRAAKGARKEFTDTAGSLYDNFRSLSRALPDPKIVPSDGIKGAAADFVEEATRKQIILKTVGDEATEILRGPQADLLNDFLGKLNRLPNKITPDQLVGLTDDLKNFINQAQADGFDIKRVVTIKKAMEEAINDLRFADDTSDAARAVISARDTAHEFFSTNITKFQGPVAGKFKQVERNIFQAGPEVPGSINADQMGDVLVGLKGPKSVDDLAALIGPENMRLAGRNFLDTHWENSLILDRKTGRLLGIDFAKFGKLTGLTSKIGGEKAKVAKILEAAGVDQQDFVKLIRVAKDVVVGKDVNAFIARRAGLAGLAGAIGGATVPGVLRTTFTKSLMVAFLLRRGVRLISSPQDLKAMTAIMAPDTSQVLRRQLVGRLIESITRQEEQEDLAGIAPLTPQEAAGVPSETPSVSVPLP